MLPGAPSLLSILLRAGGATPERTPPWMPLNRSRDTEGERGREPEVALTPVRAPLEARWKRPGRSFSALSQLDVPADPKPPEELPEVDLALSPRGSLPDKPGERGPAPIAPNSVKAERRRSDPPFLREVLVERSGPGPPPGGRASTGEGSELSTLVERSELYRLSSFSRVTLSFASDAEVPLSKAAEASLSPAAEEPC